MTALLISPQGGQEALRSLLERECPGSVVAASSLQEAIERLEVQRESFDLILCDYQGGSTSILKCLLSVCARCPCIILLDDPAILSELLLVPRDAIIETVSRQSLPAGLEKLLRKLTQDGLFSNIETPDSEFVRIETKTLALNHPLESDIYIRLSPNRYCRRFRKEDRFDESDLKLNFVDRGIEALYLKKSAMKELFDNQSESLDALMLDSALEPQVSRRAAMAKLQIVHDVVHQIGFTPQIQELTKKSVLLTLKAIGNSPKLSPILLRLQKNEGKYLASHSIMLAEISCAIAHRIGWGNSQTFLKLSLASFIHDLSLTDNELAQLRTIEEALEAKLTESQLHDFKLHPVKAAEYARMFSGIPPEVDTIIAQHHERPDATGFPRRLHQHQVHPSAAIFIVAQDLLNFFLDHIPTNARDDMVSIFLEAQQELYSEGMFAKIREALKTGVPISLGSS